METSPSISKIATALVKAQSEMSKASKDATNPFFKSKYADLNSIREACIPAFNSNGISILQPIVQEGGKNYVRTLLLHESGEYLDSFTEVVCSKQNDAQAFGSALTYARRHGMQSMANVGSQDDDGHKASQPDEPTLQPAKPTLEPAKPVLEPAYVESLLNRMDMCKNLAELKQFFEALKPIEKQNQLIINNKEQLKSVLK